MDTMSTSASSDQPNDPLTGRRALPPDLRQLGLLTKVEPRYCFFTIPGTIYYLYQTLYFDREFWRSIPYLPLFRLDTGTPCSATYTRLYTQWLYSGCCDPSLAKVYPDGTVAFNTRVRTAIYLARVLVCRKQSATEIRNMLRRIFYTGSTASTAIVAATDADWASLLQSEPVEVLEDIWEFVLPKHEYLEDDTPQRSSTVIMTEPFSAAAQMPKVPDGWHTWKPCTAPDVQNMNRKRCLMLGQHLKANEEYIDPLFTAPKSERIKLSQERAKILMARKPKEPPVPLDLDNPASNSIRNAELVRSRLRAPPQAEQEQRHEHEQQQQATAQQQQQAPVQQPHQQKQATVQQPRQQEHVTAQQHITNQHPAKRRKHNQQVTASQPSNPKQRSERSQRRHNPRPFTIQPTLPARVPSLEETMFSAPTPTHLVPLDLNSDMQIDEPIFGPGTVTALQASYNQSTGFAYRDASKELQYQTVLQAYENKRVCLLSQGQNVQGLGHSALASESVLLYTDTD